MIWQGFPEFFTTVSYNDQRRIHDFFRPAEDLTEEELLAHLEAVTAKDSKLPAAAGWAFRKLEAVYRLTFAHAKGDPERWRQILRLHQHQFVGPAARRGRRISVTVLARPRIDARRLARAVLNVAKDQVKAELEDKGEDKPAA